MKKPALVGGKARGTGRSIFKGRYIMEPHNGTGKEEIYFMEILYLEMK